MAEYLFVYGTLRPEHAPPEIAEVVRQLRHAGHGVVRGFLYDLGEYPGLRLAENGDEIPGEIFSLEPSILPSLDAYEGYDTSNPGQSLFIRKPCAVRVNDATWLCWIYEYNRQPDSARRIEGWPPRRTT